MKNNKNMIITIICILIIGIVLVLSLVIKEKERKYVEITVKDYGKIIVELKKDKAPIAVDNFLNLIDKKFYDGLTFHRIMEGFMIQGGTYDISGNRKEANTIKGEFKANGIENTLSHKRGVISMARNGVDYNSASSGKYFIRYLRLFSASSLNPFLTRIIDSSLLA